MSLTTEQLEAIRERAEKATSEPWRVGDPSFRCKKAHRHGLDDDCVDEFAGWYESDPDDTYDDRYWDRYITRDKPMESHVDVERIAGQLGDDKGGIARPADAEFIAHARTDIPALLADIDALTKERDALKRVADALVELIGESRGIDGWHKNGDIAEWDEFDWIMEPLRDAGYTTGESDG